jgi:hypothetical protein
VLPTLLREFQLPRALTGSCSGAINDHDGAVGAGDHARVGTRELGQSGRRRELGAAVRLACILMIADRSIAPGAAARKRHLGIGRTRRR